MRLGWRNISHHASQLVVPTFGQPTPRPVGEGVGRLLEFLPLSIHLQETCIDRLLCVLPRAGAVGAAGDKTSALLDFYSLVGGRELRV